ncbi:hypothetical protein [Polymorphospora rubra]|uniref:hypothetical protein n=1 Tax=Polymorphospora rubra TaxID=338584 RepID=UPI0033E23448
MARSDMLAWRSRGSPFRLMTPAAALRDILRRHGYTVYDIGNEDHLVATTPEDHTPYSATGWPGKAQYGTGYAIDIMPPRAGSGLPSLQQLGAQILADRRAGVAGISWLKYMNWEPERNNGGPCYQERWTPNYTRRSSTDRGHIHLSGLTGYETSTIAAGYDPVARIRAGASGGKGFLMALSDAQQKQVWQWAKDNNFILWRGGPGNKSDIRSYFSELKAQNAAILQALQGAGAETILTHITETSKLEVEAYAAMQSVWARELAPVIGAAVAAELAGEVTDEALEGAVDRALRRVLGGLDGATAGPTS